MVLMCLGQNLNLMFLQYTEYKKAHHWKCLVNQCEHLHQFFLQLCIANIPEHTGGSQCTCLLQTVIKHLLKMKNYASLSFCYGNQVGFYLCLRQRPTETQSRGDKGKKLKWK